MDLEANYLSLVEGDGGGPLRSVARTLLTALVPAWRVGLAVDRRRKLARRGPLGRPTVSVGNLSVGGTGKTPAVAWVAGRLRAAGHRPAVLTRGHGGQPPGGFEADEVLVLRGQLGEDVPIHADPNRHAGAAAVLGMAPGTTCFILDDGFQRRDVERDLDLVLFDASRPLAGARLLPRGLLREPPAALARADAVLLTRVTRAGPEATAAAASFVRRWHGREPLARFAHDWSGLDVHPGADGSGGFAPVSSLAGRRVHAAVGIGHPDAFIRQLVEAGGRVTGSSALSDHHRPDTSGLRAIHAAATAGGAEAVVTTAKDWVKWRTLDPGPDALPVWVPRLAFEALTAEAELVALLLHRIPLP